MRLIFRTKICENLSHRDQGSKYLVRIFSIDQSSYNSIMKFPILELLFVNLNDANQRFRTLMGTPARTHIIGIK